tara:strand:- start:42 stop:620 length:579 start_codon:yes stop_codon:yes gene_type:complete
MPVTINGSGTITGLSVGGLPDGTVDADTLAVGAASGTKLSLPSGSIVKVYHHSSANKVVGSADSWTISPTTLTVALSNSSNKFIIQSSNNIGATGDNEIALAIYKDSAVTGTAPDTGYGIQGIAGFSHRGNSNAVECIQFNFEDAAGDTSNHTYQIVAKQQTGTIRWNRSGNTSGGDSIETLSSITIYEVVA